MTTSRALLTPGRCATHIALYAAPCLAVLCVAPFVGSAATSAKVFWEVFWTLRVPRIGLTSSVFEGNARAVTDAGHSWHWTGTGFMGQTAHVGLFGHRTEHGGPYRYIHLLQPGDTWTVTTGDGREFTYRMVRRDLTNASTTNILAATRLHPGTTLSLIACTRTNFLPTSVYWRIIVTGELVSWRQI